MKVSIEISRQDMQVLYEVAESAAYEENIGCNIAEVKYNVLKRKKNVSENDKEMAKRRLAEARNRNFIACLLQNLVYDALNEEG